MPSPKQLLIEHLYDGDLRAEVERLASDGLSWRTIAAEISEAAGQDVSYESLRTWYGTTERESA